MSFKIGEIVADYEITGLLGSTGMSEVYQVRHLISHRAEAMKVLLPNLESDPDLAERFLREIRLLATLSHPAIAMLHTAFREQNQLLMIMELVDGETVHAILARRGLDLPAALALTIQILDALAYAHNRHVIHRDIKPSNVMLTRTGQAKLLDFGIARSVADVQFTPKGKTLGSFHYMSPEQFRGVSVDHRADIYSLGITLYQMATGVRPFPGTDPYAVMTSHVEEYPPPPESINPQIPAPLSSAISKAIMKDPAARFQTAQEFLESLKAIQILASDRTQIAIHNPPPTPTPTPSRPALTIFDPVSLKKLSLSLADHIGPIAGVLVQRASKTAASWDELCQALAVELPASERAAFLASFRQG